MKLEQMIEDDPTRSAREQVCAGKLVTRMLLAGPDGALMLIGCRRDALPAVLRATADVVEEKRGEIDAAWQTWQTDAEVERTGAAGGAASVRDQLEQARSEVRSIGEERARLAAEVASMERQIQALVLVNTSMERVYDRLAESVGMDPEARGDVEELIGRIEMSNADREELERLRRIVAEPLPNLRA